MQPIHLTGNAQGAQGQVESRDRHDLRCDERTAMNKLARRLSGSRWEPLSEATAGGLPASTEATTNKPTARRSRTAVLMLSSLALDGAAAVVVAQLTTPEPPPAISTVTDQTSPSDVTDRPRGLPDPAGADRHTSRLPHHGVGAEHS